MLRKWCLLQRLLGVGIVLPIAMVAASCAAGPLDDAAEQETGPVGVVEQETVGNTCTSDADCGGDVCCESGGQKRCAQCCVNSDCDGYPYWRCRTNCCEDLYYLKGCCGLGASYYNSKDQSCYATYEQCISACVWK